MNHNINNLIFNLNLNYKILLFISLKKIYKQLVPLAGINYQDHLKSTAIDPWNYTVIQHLAKNSLMLLLHLHRMLLSFFAQPTYDTWINCREWLTLICVQSIQPAKASPYHEKVTNWQVWLKVVLKQIRGHYLKHARKIPVSLLKLNEPFPNLQVRSD
jgi:hypothetical protein